MNTLPRIPGPPKEPVIVKQILAHTELWATSDGRIWNTTMQGYVKPYEDASGYLRISLKGFPVGVAHLVLTAFKGERPSKKHLARHLDDVKSNNRLDNLAWGLAVDNQRDKERNGRQVHGEATKTSKLTHQQIELIRRCLSGGRILRQTLAEMFGVHEQTISKIASGRAWRLTESKKAIVKGPCGSRNQGAKLGEDSVMAIRRSTSSSSILAKAFNVSRSTIKRIRNGTLWKHLNA